MDDRHALAHAQWHLGRLARETGDRATAFLALGEALRLLHDLRLADESRKVETELRAMKGDPP